MLKRVILLVTLSSAMFLMGCQSTPTEGTVYTRGETLDEQTVRRGVVIDIQEVKIEKDVTGAGAAVGGVLGGVAMGSSNGSTTKQVIRIIAATAGALIGEYAERQVTMKEGSEIVIDMEDGESISIVQSRDGQNFSIGDAVRIVDNGKRVRVVKVTVL